MSQVKAKEVATVAEECLEKVYTVTGVGRTSVEELIKDFQNAIGPFEVRVVMDKNAGATSDPAVHLSPMRPGPNDTVVVMVLQETRAGADIQSR